MRFLIVFLLSAVSLGSALADELAVPFKVENAAWIGNGCPDDSRPLLVSPGPNGQALSVSYPEEFSAEGGSHRGTFGKKCMLMVDVTFPAAFKCAISASSFDGIVELDEGASAQHFVKAWFAQSLNPAVGIFSQVVRGPFSGAYAGKSAAQPDSRLSWAGCEEGSPERMIRRRLIIDGNLFVQSSRRGSYGFIRGENGEGQIAQTFAIKWKRCH